MWRASHAGTRDPEIDQVFSRCVQLCELLRIIDYVLGFDSNLLIQYSKSPLTTSEFGPGRIYSKLRSVKSVRFAPPPSDSIGPSARISLFCVDHAILRVAVGLRKRNAATRKLLGEGVLASYRAGSPNFHVGLEHLYNLGNVRDLVKDDMFHIPSVTTPQAFKIAKDPADGEVKMQVQARSYKDEWGVIDRFVCFVCALTCSRSSRRFFGSSIP